MRRKRKWIVVPEELNREEGNVRSEIRYFDGKAQAEEHAKYAALNSRGVAYFVVQLGDKAWRSTVEEVEA